jgi:hypothetical protein
MWCAKRLKKFIWQGRMINDWFIQRMKEGIKRKLFL